MTSVDSRGTACPARTAGYTPHWLDRWPITVRLFTTSMLSLLALMSVGLVAGGVMRMQRNDMAGVTLLSRALLFVQRADMQHDAIQARAFALMLDASHAEARRDALERELEGYRQSVVDVLSLPLPQALRDDVHSLDPAIANYIYQAENVSHGVAADAQPSDAMPAVEAAFTTLARGETLTLPNFGLETIHHVHADDVAGLFMAAIGNWGASVGESFHAVSDRALTLRGYAEAMAAWFGREPKLDFLPYDRWAVTQAPEDAQATWEHIARSPNCSMEKAKRLLGFTPRFTSLEAVKESVEWLIANGRVQV